MNPSTSTRDAETVGPAPTRRWPGVLLSLFVPGFGLVRAGRPLRGLAWFVASYLLTLVALLLLIARAIPTMVVGAAFVLCFIALLLMLADSLRSGRMTWRLYLGFVIAFVALAFLPKLPRVVVASFRVPTEGMQPTLRGTSGGRTPDYIFVDKLTYRFSPPRRGDLIVFRTAGISGLQGESLFVQRLVGLPGERIELRNGAVYANGVLLDESAGMPSLRYEPIAAQRRSAGSATKDEYTVAAEGYFMMGDNSAHSFDSRYWGSVPRQNIYGRVARIYYPFSRSGVPK